MDFLDPKSRKAHRTRLFIGYALMAVALGISTLLIVLLTSGYDVDRTTGNVIQNGLVTVDSHPQAADIFVNDEPKGRTDQRLILPEGRYSVELKEKGFRSWRHDLTLEGSSIEQLVYPFMFPEKLVTKTLKTYDALPSMISQSPDRRWLVAVVSGKLGNFELTDLNDEKHPQTTLVLPSDTFTPAAGDHIFKEVEWASDNSHLLLEHTWASGVEYILLDRNTPLSSLNISKLFPGQAGFKISLRDKKTDQFYLYNPATKSLMSGLASSKVAIALLAHAVQFKAYKDNTILYVNDKSEVHLLQKDKDYFIRSLPESPKYLLDYAEFNNKAYLVCGSPTDKKTYVYVDPLKSLTRTPARTPQPLRVLIVDNPEFVSFSAIARFIAVQGGSKFAVFDAETGRQFRYDTALPLAAGQKAAWMDGHRLQIESGAKTAVFDFDGKNQQSLNATVALTHSYFNRDFDAMFSFAPENGKTSLTRTELLVK